MARKVPPPPNMASENPELNRWLLELTSILSDDGSVNPDDVEGLDQLALQVQQNTLITAGLQQQYGALSNGLASLQQTVAALAQRVTNAETAIVQLQNRPTLYYGALDPTGGLGRDGDWYGKLGSGGVWVKDAGTWVPVAT